MAAAIAAVQERLNDGWVSTLQEAQHRGFVRADIDTRATALMIQAMALGRILDDAAGSHLTNERWAQTYFDIVDRALLTHDD